MTARVVALALVLPLAAAALAGCSGGDGAAAPAGSVAASLTPTATASVPATSPTPSDEATAGPAAQPTASSAPPFATPTSTEVVPAPVDGEIPELPPVAVGETVEAGGGLTAEVLELEASEITGGVPGDVAGPAVAVTVEIVNSGTTAADVASLLVSAAYGDGQEAPGFDGGDAAPLVGPVPPGESRRGTYVFGVPSLGAGTLEVRVGTDPARPLAVFTADASVWGDR